jgi:preprotein translocase subunit YajC
MHLNEILAQATTTASGTPSTSSQQAPAGLQGMFNSPIPMLVLFGVIFYFILIRPQQKRAKQQAQLVSSIKAGDKVVTASGIIGTVITVKDKTVSLRSADAKMEVTKASVTEILQGSDAVEA